MLPRRPGQLPTHVLSLLLGLLVLSCALAYLAAPSADAAPQHARADCTGPVPGKHVYDCVGLLTSAELENLESHAKAVEQAGAPTVVYLQARDATRDQTEQDAIDLMTRWDVESRPGARDGFVMFLNLKPFDTRHGEVFLYAGQKHTNGNLPPDDLQRIYSDEMLPLLRNEQTAAGIAAGLDAVAHDLRYGPPPPSPATVAARTIGRLPFNIFSLLFALAIALYYVAARRGRPAAGQYAMTPPGNLAPAIVGALVRGRISDDQMEATILDFARRGLLQIEPVGTNVLQVRLLPQQSSPPTTGYEASLWDQLTSLAGDQNVISAGDMAQIPTGWPLAKSRLREMLISRGWYDPNAANAKRRPLYIAGALGLCASALGIIVAIVAQEGWAVIGACIYLAASILAFVLARAIPDTSLEGEQQAAPWRGYFNSIKTHVPVGQLDDALPYMLAMGARNAVPNQLKIASGEGYSPAWFRSEQDRHWGAYGFYPYWIAWHTSLYPPPPPGSGGHAGGYGGGGAAGGGGGGGGSF